ncbi:MAG: DUF72 domain-containing protein [Candidatus Obscuribacterales bacterium]|nr:DUF72 domain-containing protein [Steroidobacteraceae bacterium]
MKPSTQKLVAGTAGWSIPRAVGDTFVGDGTHLERYARILQCAEINSSFYRPHAFKVYERWAAQTPATFRFAVKLPRIITHDQRLRRARAPLERFLSEVAGLGKKLGALLIQLPPSLDYDARTARTFFNLLRERHAGPVVCEPRHATWFDVNAEQLMVKYRVARAAADPAVVPQAKFAGGSTAQIVYYRLHGSPRMYWSKYSSAQLRSWRSEISERKSKVATWFIFDNTASGSAIENALELYQLAYRKR